MFNVQQIDFDAIPVRAPSCARYGVISDVHVGHRRTPTWFILENLNKYITNVKFMLEIDALFVTGDFFDRLLNLPTDDVDDIKEWVINLLRLSKKCNTPIRVLEGTPSHDWKQSALIPKENERHGINADVMFVDTLDIIKDDALGITIGYVPDEIRENCEQTTVEFKEIMATKGYDQVDVILMHGMFEFQIPKAAAKVISAFKEDEWTSLARIGIFIGHDHRHKTKYNIVIPGSWDRLAHNEEDLKGGLLVDYRDGITEVYHLINRDAMRYITIRGLEMTDVEVIAKAEEALRDFGRLDEPRGRLKVIYDRKYDISSRVNEWKAAFDNVLVEASGQYPEEVTAAVELNDQFKIEVEAININPENIDGMIMREVDVPTELYAVFQDEIELIKSSI